MLIQYEYRKRFVEMREGTAWKIMKTMSFPLVHFKFERNDKNLWHKQ